MKNNKISILNKFPTKSRADMLKYATSFILLFGVILMFTFLIFNYINAATNIDATYKYAWNDVIGWVDFGYSDGNVNVYSDRLEGYAGSSMGFIALNCNTTPNGNICGTSNFKVSNSGGYLTGWAYNDAIGWISFDSGTATSSITYQVTISASSGDFSGFAWNDNVGFISFNCLNTGTCGTSDYKVKTSLVNVPITAELTSSVFDTGVSTGVILNTIMWQGNQPNGTGVKFQIASDSTSTPATWIYRGPDGSNTTYYAPAGNNVPAQINPAYHSNIRYFRYKAFLTSDAGQTSSPRVDDIIVNWSP